MTTDTHATRFCRSVDGAKRYAQGRGGNSQMYRCPVCLRAAVALVEEPDAV